MSMRANLNMLLVGVLILDPGWKMATVSIATSGSKFVRQSEPHDIRGTLRQVFF